VSYLSSNLFPEDCGIYARDLSRWWASRGAWVEMGWDAGVDRELKIKIGRDIVLKINDL
jgi:hypothetical protein